MPLLNELSKELNKEEKRQKQKLLNDIESLEKSLNERRKAGEAEISKAKQDFDAYKNEIQSDLTKREKAIADNEKEFKSIDKDRESLGKGVCDLVKEKADLELKKKDLSKAVSEAEDKKEDAEALIALYNIKIQELD